MDKSLAVVDWHLADIAADRIALAYEIAEALGAYAGESPNRRAGAIVIAHVTTAFNLIDLGLDDKQAAAEFRKILKSTRAAVEAIGKDARLRDVLVEMHLDHT